MKLKPITVETADGEGVEIFCTHRNDWPPAHARLPDTADSLRASGAITETKYQQLQTWQRVCGLMAMDPEKCVTCKLALHKTPTGQFAKLAPGDDPQVRLPPFARAKQGLDNR